MTETTPALLNRAYLATDFDRINSGMPGSRDDAEAGARELANRW